MDFALRLTAEIDRNVAAALIEDIGTGDLTALVLPPELLEELMRYSAPLSRRIIGALAQRLMRMNQSAAG